MSRSAKWTGYGREVKIVSADSGFVVTIDEQQYVPFDTIEEANAFFTVSINRIRDEQIAKSTSTLH